jgi:hypothetical protein
LVGTGDGVLDADIIDFSIAVNCVASVDVFVPVQSLEKQ